MTYITLICAAGLSTSMLMEKMKAYAASHHLDVQVEAMPEGKFENCGRHTDILLLGPQVGYLREDMETRYRPAGMKVAVIDMMDYGMMDGGAVLSKALRLL